MKMIAYSVDRGGIIELAGRKGMIHVKLSFNGDDHQSLYNPPATNESMMDKKEKTFSVRPTMFFVK